jgi:hypothetical protein
MTEAHEDFEEWAKVWHKTCETMMTMIGLSSSGCPQEMLAELQAHLGHQQAPPIRDEIARIIDPEAMGLAHKMGRPDLALTAEMQERIRTARTKADAILAHTRPDGNIK